MLTTSKEEPFLILVFPPAYGGNTGVVFGGVFETDEDEEDAEDLV